MERTPAPGLWWSGGSPPAFEPIDLADVEAWVRRPSYLVRDEQGRIGAAQGGELGPSERRTAASLPLVAALPAVFPEWLGDRSFGAAHGVRFPYIAGEMA